MAAGAGSLGRRAVHAANAGAFLAGTIQSHAALPVRVALLRRVGGPAASRIPEIALADAPIFLLELCTSALLGLLAATALPGVPLWFPVAVLAGAVLALWLLCAAHVRFRHRPLARGLAVLADPARRNRLVVLVLALTLVAFLRTWLVLVGFGLPSTPADVALMLVALGSIGLLPLGVGTAPMAAIAALGTSGIAAAAAAGLAISAGSLIAVIVYAAGCWTLGASFMGRHPESGEPPAQIRRVAPRLRLRSPLSSRRR